MAATKAHTSLWSSQAVAVGTPQTSAVIDLSATYGSVINIKITNGGTGPTVPLQVQVWVGNDYNGGTPTLEVKFGGAFSIGSANNAVDTTSIEIPIGVAAVKLIAGSNTGQTVTVDADISSATAVS